MGQRFVSCSISPIPTLTLLRFTSRSQFFTTFQFPVAAPAETEALPEFQIAASHDSYDESTNVRSLTLKIEHVSTSSSPVQ